MPIPFHALSISDKEMIQQRVLHTECRNCDLNFMNLFSWRFLYDTEVAYTDDWLLFRFKADGHLAYLAPTGEGNWSAVMQNLLDDAQQQGHPFLMLGVCENSLTQLEMAMPDYFFATADRNFSDYVYEREKLATLSGKKLQSKRNFANRFMAQHPNYEVLPLDAANRDECLHLDELWAAQKSEETDSGRYTYDAERRSLLNVFEHWDELGGLGAVLKVDGRIIAFTYGAPINADTFDVCMEKADTTYDGAFAMINREFAKIIPPQYRFVNREEDLGIEGLRQSKLSYRPTNLLHKYTVMTKHPLGKGMITT